MIKERIKKTQDFILGNDERLSLEHRLLLFALLMGVFMGLLGGTINSLTTKSLVASVIPLILSIVTFILYYFVRFKFIFKPLAILTSILGIIGISIVWVFNGGINGPNIMVAFVVLVMALMIVSDELKKYIVAFFILANTFIFCIQIYRPEIIVGYLSEQARWLDYIVCLIYSSILIFLIMRFIHSNYTLERKRAEENEFKIQQKNNELLKLNADKDQFMQILAHDLKNPFNAIIGFSNLLLMNARQYDMAKIEEHLLILNQTAKSTFGLLEDLLLWSQSQSGKLPFEPVMVRFSEICEEIISVLRVHANEKNISIKCLESTQILIFADVNMIKTIIRNLISNAIKFTNENGQINIYVERHEMDATIIISDNGVGIESENLLKLWDLAKIISTNGTANEKGTGLGLSLCKEFVEKHKGRIWVESEPGKGSDFKFTIPISDF